MDQRQFDYPTSPTNRQIPNIIRNNGRRISPSAAQNIGDNNIQYVILGPGVLNQANPHQINGITLAQATSGSSGPRVLTPIRLNQQNANNATTGIRLISRQVQLGVPVQARLINQQQQQQQQLQQPQAFNPPRVQLHQQQQQQQQQMFNQSDRDADGCGSPPPRLTRPPTVRARHDDVPPTLLPQTQPNRRTPEPQPPNNYSDRDTKDNIGLGAGQPPTGILRNTVIQNQSQGRNNFMDARGSGQNQSQGQVPGTSTGNRSNPNMPPGPGQKVMRLRCKYRPLHNIYTQQDQITGQVSYLEHDGDVEFCCRDGIILGHKVILCCASEFFSNCFKGQNSSEMTSLVVPDFTCKIVRAALTLAYTPEIKLIATFNELAEIENVMNVFGLTRDRISFHDIVTGNPVQPFKVYPPVPTTPTAPGARPEKNNMNTSQQGHRHRIDEQPRHHPRKAIMNRSMHRRNAQPFNLSLPASTPMSSSHHAATLRNIKLSPSKSIRDRHNDTIDDFANFNNIDDGGEEDADGSESFGTAFNRWSQQVGAVPPPEPDEVDPYEVDEDFRCTVCRTRFTDRAKYDHHQDRHTRQGVYTCQTPNCAEAFDTLARCKAHEKQNHEPHTRKRRMSSASPATPRKRGSYEHQQGNVIYMAFDENTKTSDNIFICAGCGKSSLKQELARQHYFDCQLCRGLDRNCAIEKRKRGFVGNIVCDICDRSYIKNLGFTIHCGHKHIEHRKLFNYVSNNDKLQCATCSLIFNVPYELGNHLRNSRPCGSRDYGSSSPVHTFQPLTASLKRKVTTIHKQSPSTSTAHHSRSRSPEIWEYDPPNLTTSGVHSTLSRSTRLAEREKKKYGDGEDEPVECPICDSFEEHFELHLAQAHPDLQADITVVNQNLLHCVKCNSKIVVCDLQNHLNNCRGRKRQSVAGSNAGGGGTDNTPEQRPKRIEIYTPGMDNVELAKLALRCGICGRVEKRIADITSCLHKHGYSRCSLCFNSYQDKAELEAHVDETHRAGNKYLVCPICGDTRQRSSQLTTHMHSAHWRTILRSLLAPEDWTASLNRSLHPNRNPIVRPETGQGDNAPAAQQNNGEPIGNPEQPAQADVSIDQGGPTDSSQT